MLGNRIIYHGRDKESDHRGHSANSNRSKPGFHMLSCFVPHAWIDLPSRFMAGIVDILWKVTIYKKLMSNAIFPASQDLLDKIS